LKPATQPYRRTIDDQPSSRSPATALSKGALAAPLCRHRHGHRARQLVGSFGSVEITVPRARIAADGRTDKWKSTLSLQAGKYKNYDAGHDVVKCPRDKACVPASGSSVAASSTPAPETARDVRWLASACPSVNKAVVIGDDYPALLRARRRRDRWSCEDRRLYQRHRWRSEGFHGEAKTWHGLARAVRRGLDNMQIQAFLTAAAINLKRLATALA
jgi:hypothetical protein